MYILGKNIKDPSAPIFATVYFVSSVLFAATGNIISASMLVAFSLIFGSITYNQWKKAEAINDYRLEYDRSWPYGTFVIKKRNKWGRWVNDKRYMKIGPSDAVITARAIAGFMQRVDPAALPAIGKRANTIQPKPKVKGSVY